MKENKKGIKIQIDQIILQGEMDNWPKFGPILAVDVFMLAPI